MRMDLERIWRLALEDTLPGDDYKHVILVVVFCSLLRKTRETRPDLDVMDRQNQGLSQPYVYGLASTTTHVASSIPILAFKEI